jgi:hypothetical protein
MANARIPSTNKREKITFLGFIKRNYAFPTI